MTRSILLVILMVIGIAPLRTKAQHINGEIRGKVTDSKTKILLDYVSISLLRNNNLITSVISDDSGFYMLKNIAPGEYEIKVSNIGYRNAVITQIEVKSDMITFQNIQMELNTGVTLADIVIVRKKPLIDAEGKGSGVVTSKEIMRSPARSINMIANSVAGVESRAGGTPNFRGSRANGTAYYIDGIRVGGSSQLPQNSVSVPVQVQNDETYAYINENEFKSVKSDPLSTFSIDVDKASYAIVRRYLNDQQLPPKDAVRIEEMINYFPYDAPEITGNIPFAITTEVVRSPWKKDSKIVQITLNAKKISLDKAPENNLVFLIDVSGSMSSSDKLPLLKSCMHMLIEQLRSQDKVAIVVYAGSSGLVLDATNGNEKEKILNAVDELSSGGSTAGGEGIKLAYKIAAKNFIKGGNNRVILATDGDFNVGITDPSELTRLIEEKRNSGVYLSVLGFGTGNYKDATMEQLADKGNGNYAYIDNLMEGKKVLVKEMGGTLYTVAKDVKIQVEFNPEFVKSYRLIGYENRMLNNEDFNNDKKDAGELGSGHCVTAIYELVTKESKDKQLTDELKYQEMVTTSKGKSNEMMTVKVRYKDPEDTVSKKLEIPVMNTDRSIDSASGNLRFAVAVASFGMKLRDSKFSRSITYNDIIRMAKGAKGKDDDGYRAEFIRLIETRDLIASK